VGKVCETRTSVPTAIVASWASDIGVTAQHASAAIAGIRSVEFVIRSRIRGSPLDTVFLEYVTRRLKPDFSSAAQGGHVSRIHPA
jgi:hypothetical protein